MNIKKLKISFYINLIIVIFTVFATIVMFTGYKFMHGYEIVLESTSLGMFRFFTVDSNIFMGIVSFIFLIKEYKLLTGKETKISIMDYIFKLMSTTAVGLTFFVVFAYLGPISEHGILSMLMNSNLFFHFLIPVLSIVNFIFFEKTNLLNFKYTIFGIIPTLIYGIGYLINILIHMENGKVSPLYDWYWFVQNGVWTACIVMPVILIISFLISLLLWKLNRLKMVHIENKKSKC